MFLKFIAVAAIAAAPAVVHAQGTTPRDTSMQSTRVHTDSIKTDTSNGSVYTKKKSTTTRDTVSTRRTHTDSTMNVSPIDSTRMGVPSTPKTTTPTRTPPR